MMDELPPGALPSEGPPKDRLDSWKEIAAYLNRDVTTVQRWEKREGMPVHRHLHDKRGSVYALGPELHAWLQSRRLRLEEQEKDEEIEEEKEEQKEVAGKFEAPVDAETDQGLNPTSRSRYWLVVAAVAVLGLVAVTYFMSRSRIQNSGRPKIKSIAVLPLKNLSGDPAQEYLADGMTEALIGRLAGIRDLRVISHTSVMQFKNPQLSVPQIAKMLHVDAIVEGSVMREGNRIRVTAQLIRGSTDEHFWSETYDRELSDALTLQSELAQSIAKKVEATVSGQEQERLAATRTVAPEVYESYLKGWYAIGRGNSKSGIEESMTHFEDAIKKDPTFAPAYLGLAESLAELDTPFIGAPSDQTQPKVMSAIKKALELDPNLADAHAMLADALMRQWHWADAETEYRRALELSPNNADAHLGLASWFLCHGRSDEALTWARRARELDPLSVSGTDIGWILFLARHYDDAIHELRSELAVDPDDAGTLWYLGFVLIANNQANDAIPLLEKAATLSNRSPGVLGVLIRAYAHAGRRSDALRVLAELKNRQKDGYVPAAAFVHAYLGLDENEEAFNWLEQAYKEQSKILLFIKVHPYFDPLRSDPRFVDLVRRVGLS
jgi:TolB-like protein/Tfp pilus assembly protein PilF